MTMRNGIRGCVLGLLPLLLGLQSAAWAGDFYKWTDDQGVTHYSQDPPQGADTERVRTFEGKSRSPAAAEKARESYRDQLKPDSEKSDDGQGANKRTAQADPGECKKARKNLETMRNNNRVRVKNEDGYRYISAEQKKKKIQKNKDFLDTYCQ